MLGVMIKFFYLFLILPFSIWLLLEVSDIVHTLSMIGMKKKEKEYLLIFFILFLIGVFGIYRW